MNEYVEVSYEDPEKLHLKETVFIAYNDANNAGNRALLGLDMRVEYYMLPVPELAHRRPSCSRSVPPQPHQQHFEALQVLNCKYEQFSFVVINTEVRGREAHYVVAKILHLCQVSAVKKLVILSVVQLPHHVTPADMFELCLYSQPVSSYSTLPQDTKICDPFLCTFIQMIQIDRTPSSVLIIPSYAGERTKARENITKFQDFIAKLTKLRFSSELSKTLELERQKTTSWKLMYG